MSEPHTPDLHTAADIGPAAVEQPPESPDDYYRRRYRHASADELITEIIRLHHGYGTELAKTEEQLCLALGMVEDPLYGFPTGDHTTVTLAMSLRTEVERLHAATETTATETTSNTKPKSGPRTP